MYTVIFLSVVLTVLRTITYHSEPIYWYDPEMLMELGKYYEQIKKLQITYLSDLIVTIGVKYTLSNGQNLVVGSNI